MDIQDLGAIGEFISSVVIVITLIFLTLETRQTRHATLQGNREARQRIRHDLHRLRAENPSLVEIIVKANNHLADGDDLANEKAAKDYGLTQVEHHRLQAVMSASTTHWFDQFYTELPESDRLSLDGQVKGTISNPVFRKFWAERREGFPDDFTDYIEGLLQSS